MSEVENLVTCYIDGKEVSVPKGTLVIRAAEKIGVAIPRFCDHPLLDPVGACRQCLVEVPDAGNGRGFPKPQASCTLEVMPGMQVKTQHTSAMAEKAQKGIMELLLINHPLDCPICDKGGECPLQNQAMSNGRSESRYDGVKRTFPKPINVSAQILLDRERCVLCARCTRFSEQIAGDPFIALVERGALQQVGYYEKHPYHSYFSGNVVQICPVGALTSERYRFQSRPFDLVSTPNTCEHCAGGCQIRSDHRHYQVKRRQAGNAPEINEEWICDKGRFAFLYGHQEDRLKTPMIRENGELRPASWPEAIDVAVAGLKAAKQQVGVLPGGRLTMENAYGYAKFARVVLGVNNIDYRARTISEEETAYLAAEVAGKDFAETVHYLDLQQAKRVVLVAFEPEEEASATFLRLRKGWRKFGLQVVAVAPYLSRGNEKLGAQLCATRPGAEAKTLAGLELTDEDIVLVGERAVSSPGLLSLLVDSPARVAWIPRRAGEMGAIEVGALPNLLPGGRPLSNKAAIVDIQTAWDVDSLNTESGLDLNGQLAAAAAGTLKALLLGGLELRDLPNPELAKQALANTFVVSLEQRASEIVNSYADVVFPVALTEEIAGTFLNWEHREGRLNRVITQNNSVMTDLRILAALADAMAKPLGIRTVKQAKAEIDEIGKWDGERATFTSFPTVAESQGMVLSSWHELLTGSAALAGESALQATAKPLVIRIPLEKATELGVLEGDNVTIAFGGEVLSLPVVIEESMVKDTVWVAGYAAASGTPVSLKVGGVA